MSETRYPIVPFRLQNKFEKNESWIWWSLVVLHLPKISASFPDNPSTLLHVPVYLVGRQRVEIVHMPIGRLVCQQASNSQPLERVEEHNCSHILCPQIPFYPNTKLGEISTFKNCRLFSSFWSYEWQVANWKLSDHANLSFSCFYFLLLFFRKPQELNQQFLSFLPVVDLGKQWCPPTLQFSLCLYFLMRNQPKSLLKMQLGRKSLIRAIGCQ